jgi:hypothetical protein
MRAENIEVNPAKCPKWSIRQWPCSKYVAPVDGFARCQIFVSSNLCHLLQILRVDLAAGGIRMRNRALQLSPYSIS